jgi:hypothetical protein
MLIAEWSIVGSAADSVGGIGVTVGRIGVAVGRTRVAVGGIGVAVGADDVWNADVSAKATRVPSASADHSGVAIVPQELTSNAITIRGMNLLFIAV